METSYCRVPVYLYVMIITFQIPVVNNCEVVPIKLCIP